MSIEDEARTVADGMASITTPLSTIDAEAIRWHWPGVVALGKVTLIAGDPGLGKSLITADMTARTTGGIPWPDGCGTPETGSVIFASAEDDPSDTIRPRMEAAGADVSRVHILSTITEIDDEGEIRERGFSLKRDIHRLSLEVERIGDCKLIVIDPVSAYLGGVDSHKNAELRELLAPLSDLAARHRVAVVAVSHLNKAQGGNVLYRIAGSLAFVAAARAGWIVVKDQSDESRRLVLPAKNNLAPDDAGGFAYRVTTEQTNVGEVPVVDWEPERVDVSALDAMDTEEERTAREEAEEFIISMLNNGEDEAKKIVSAAKAAGIASRTLDRAKSRLRIKSERDGFGGKWRWHLPIERHSTPNQNMASLASYEQSGGLEGESKNANGVLSLQPESPSLSIERQHRQYSATHSVADYDKWEV